MSGAYWLWCSPSSAGMIAHIHTAARYVKGLEMGALQGLHWDTLIAIIIIIIIITGCHQERGLRSNFQTCLNDHRKWNVRSYYHTLLLVWRGKKGLEDRSKGDPTLLLSDDLKHFGVCLHKSLILKEIDQNEGCLWMCVCREGVQCVCECVCVCEWKKMLQGILNNFLQCL